MMTQVVVWPRFAKPETFSIVKNTSTGFSGDAFEFVSEWEAAHFARTFSTAYPSVRAVGAWTQEVLGMSNKEMNKLL